MSSKEFHPKVTVLMSVFNGERFLREAVDSVLTQTFGDFEFLVIDDGSTDGTGEILESCKDPRLRICPQEHRGLIGSLNRGLELARGEYIARMDADDVSRNDRLALEVDALDRDQSLTLVGSFYEVIDDVGRILRKTRLQSDPVYRLWRLRFHNTYAHGSVMYRRKEIVEAGGYREEWIHVEDYDLWLRISSQANTYMIPSYLYGYRLSGGPQQISSRHNPMQTSKWATLSSLRLKAVNAGLTEDLCKELRSIYWDRERGRLGRGGIGVLPATIRGFCERFDLSAAKEADLMARVGLDALWATVKLAAEGKGVGLTAQAFRTFGPRLLKGLAGAYPEILRKALRLH